MRIRIDRSRVSCPFIEIVEPVAVRILLKNVCIRDRQSELLEPFVRHRWMYFGGLQRRRQTIRADKMFLRHKKAGPTAERPLRRLMQFFGGSPPLLRFLNWRYAFLTRGPAPLSKLGNYT